MEPKFASESLMPVVEVTTRPAGVTVSPISLLRALYGGCLGRAGHASGSPAGSRPESASPRLDTARVTGVEPGPPRVLSVFRGARQWLLNLPGRLRALPSLGYRRSGRQAETQARRGEAPRQRLAQAQGAAIAAAAALGEEPVAGRARGAQEEEADAQNPCVEPARHLSPAALNAPRRPEPLPFERRPSADAHEAPPVDEAAPPLTEADDVTGLSEDLSLQARIAAPKANGVANGALKVSVVGRQLLRMAAALREGELDTVHAMELKALLERYGAPGTDAERPLQGIVLAGEPPAWPLQPWLDRLLELQALGANIDAVVVPLDLDAGDSRLRLECLQRLRELVKAGVVDARNLHIWCRRPMHRYEEEIRREVESLVAELHVLVRYDRSRIMPWKMIGPPADPTRKQKLEIQALMGGPAPKQPSDPR